MEFKSLNFTSHRSNNKTRTEDIELAQTNDRLVGEAWVGHPYYELIDNSTDFETKMRRLCRYFPPRPNCQRNNHHFLTGLSLQGYTYLMPKSSCIVILRRESFWWNVRVWSLQWRGRGLGSATFRFGLLLFLRLKKHFLIDKQVHHDYLPCFPNGPQARIRRRGRHGRLHCLNFKSVYPHRFNK